MLGSHVSSMTEALRPLAQLILPHRQQPPDGRQPLQAPTAQAGARVGELCALLALMLQKEPLKQGTLVSLAASADIVPRLWFSHLKVRLPSTSGVPADISLWSDDAAATLTVALHQARWREGMPICRGLVLCCCMACRCIPVCADVECRQRMPPTPGSPGCRMVS